MACWFFIIHENDYSSYLYSKLGQDTRKKTKLQGGGLQQDVLFGALKWKREKAKDKRKLWLYWKGWTPFGVFSVGFLLCLHFGDIG